mmetsp:Transcript_24638/g.38413  ORF Transcript_24638/g.38413 Transcript_24638/m.38413 type:complete len:496 (-) Transcript_24638:116-1603(-)|eukprot:CAMPEP_0201511744 /NCGR_PEP_ID=MMETSP0161_2-20130828/4144_1 /ASSEMBLY_ACC=CAM_ASM_000251 /TAXON_ID=180227 /ORGANISM="Neoparamoeba aestuarina, Strain SoJaBio B1-5/56/2" /LENGTH=495 /DNA_ID=CAMNT_0047907351 /DNA_START=117 /DNA_END=1604 /DNA_ORIENTATION=+
MSKEEDYDDYSDEDDGDDIHAMCLACGTLNRFPGKDIPKILCYECGEIIEANPDPPPPAAVASTPTPASPKPTPAPATSSSSNVSYNTSPSSSSQASYSSSSQQGTPKKKKSIFSIGKKDKKKKGNVTVGGLGQGGVGGEGNPAITAPVFVKHVSGATQSDNLGEAENGLLSGNKPDPSIPVDVEKKSQAMGIPMGAEKKPLIGGMETVTAPTNVRKNPDPLSSIQQGGKPKLNKEEKKKAKEKERTEKKIKKVYEKEARKSAKSGVVLEKRKFPAPTATTTSGPPPGVINKQPSGENKQEGAGGPQVKIQEQQPEEDEESEEIDEDEVSEVCPTCGSLNVFPPGADRVACYECDTPISAPVDKNNNQNENTNNTNNNAENSAYQDQEDSEEDEDDEITDVCPSCGTLNAFPSDTVPQIACYNCATPIDNPRLASDPSPTPTTPTSQQSGGGDADDGEEQELQAFCSKCGSLNIFPPEVFAVACWECETPIYYNN